MKYSIFLLLFLGFSFLNTISAQRKSSLPDSLGPAQDERNKPLGDTTSVQYYYLDLPEKLIKIDTGLINFEYPHQLMGLPSLLEANDLGHLGTPTFPILFQTSPKGGFRVGLNQLDPYRLKRSDISYFKVAKQRPYTDLYYSQISLQNVALRANFAHEVDSQFYYAIHYNIINYNGYFSGHRSRHQNIALAFRFSSKSGNYKAYLTGINTANNQSENGGIQDTSLIEIPVIYLGARSVLLKLNNDGSPKNEYRHQSLDLEQFWYNGKTSEIGHHIGFQSNSYKYFDSNPASDSSFYGLFQTNNRGIRHYIGHLQLSNELSYRQAVGGSLENAPLVFRASIGHFWNWLNQEPNRSQIHNFQAKLLVYDQMQKSFSYRAEGIARTSRLGIDFSINGQLEYQLGQWATLGGDLLFQRYEPTQIAQTLLVTRTPIWDNSSILTQQQDFSLKGYLAWPKWWGRFEISNHTCTRPIYFDSLGIAQQWAGSTNIMQLRLRQDLHLWKLHLENEAVWQRILAGQSIMRLPEWILQSKLYFQGRAFKTVNLKTGANVRYFSSFKANAYLPIHGQFYLQNERSLNFYPVVDVFVSAKIWQMRFFVNAENLTYFLYGSQAYYVAPNYAVPNWWIRVGASWQIFD